MLAELVEVKFQLTAGALVIWNVEKDMDLMVDILDIFKDAGIEKKSGAAVENDEYELFLHVATKSHQIKNIDDYLDGKTKITVINEKAEQPKEVKPEPKPEAKPAPKAAPEVKAEAKPQPKPEVKPAPAVKAEQPKPQQDRPQRKPEGKPNFENKPRQPQGQQGAISTPNV